jgi:hypothetical protein
MGVRKFATTFAIRFHEGTQPNPGDGITFTIQGNSPTALALDNGAPHGSLGYGDDQDTPPFGLGGIRNSAAIKFKTYDTEGDTNNSTGLYTNGKYPGVSRQAGDVNVPLDPNVVNLRDQHTKQIDMSYDSTTLTVTITDVSFPPLQQPAHQVTQAYAVDIPGKVGSDIAYVGFTGGTGGRTFISPGFSGPAAWSLQDVLTWRYESQDPRPAAPSNLRIPSVTPAGVNLAWRCSSFEDGFKIERSTDGVVFNQVATTGPTVTSYQDTGLTAGTAYYYRVRASNSAGDSVYSNVDSVRFGAVAVDHSGGFASNSDLTANQNYAYNPIFTGSMAQLTDGTQGDTAGLRNYGEAGSVFLTNRVGIGNFSTTFTFKIAAGTPRPPATTPPPLADGLTFTIQGTGPTAVGGPTTLGDSGGSLGYSGIRKSVAIKFDIFNNAGEGDNSTGLFFDGDFPTVPQQAGEVNVPLDPAIVNLSDQHVKQVNLSYVGTSLVVTITDTEHAGGPTSLTQRYTVDIAAKIGSNVGFGGFTGGTNGTHTAVQAIQTWTGTFSPGRLSRLSVSAPPASTAGSAFNVNVTAFDDFNSAVTNYRGTVHFASSDSQATLPSDYTFTPADGGSHTFAVTLRTAGNQTVNATDTANASVTGTAAVMVNPAAASTLVVAGFPSPVTAGTSSSFTVTAKDPYGNTATGYAGTIHFTSSDPQGVLPYDYAFEAADNGMHTFSATLKTAGSQFLTATDTQNPNITGTQAGIVVNPAPASTLIVAGFPSPTTAGVAGNFTVTAQDPYGNTATSYRGGVHFTSSDPQAALPADYVFIAADSGVHTFNATLKTAGSQSITATDTATASITGSQTGIVVNPAAASNLVVAGFPSPTRPDETHNFTVTANDPYGNVATGYAGTVTFSSDADDADLPADYTFTAADMGTHVFSAAFHTNGLFSLTATDTLNPSITGTQSGIVVLDDGGGGGSPRGGGRFHCGCATADQFLAMPSFTANVSMPVTVLPPFAPTPTAAGRSGSSAIAVPPAAKVPSSGNGIGVPSTWKKEGETNDAFVQSLLLFPYDARGNTEFVAGLLEALLG